MKFLGLALVLAALPANAAINYQVSCSATGTSSPVANVTIASAFGEPRSSSSGGRFHGGVDIRECDGNILNMSAYAILGGLRKTPTACSGTPIDCVRIYNQATKTHFDYVHITPDPTLPPVNSTTPILAGGLIGAIDAGSYLHLQEATILPVGDYRLNPQRSNALNFNHAGYPTFTQTSISGASNQSLILLPKSQFTPEGSQPNPTSFLMRDGIFYVRQSVSVLLAASGGNGTIGDRKGIYSAGFVLQPGARQSYSFNIPFMAIADRATIIGDYKTRPFPRELGQV